MSQDKEGDLAYSIMIGPKQLQRLPSKRSMCAMYLHLVGGNKLGPLATAPTGGGCCVEKPDSLPALISLASAEASPSSASAPGKVTAKRILPSSPVSTH